MSQHTTSITTDGLVFAYDMNSPRSYRGRVATNLLQYIVSDSVSVSSNNNYRVSTGTEDVYIPSLGEMKGVVYTDVMNDYNNSYGGGGSGNCCPRIMRYAEGVSVSPNTTYTYAIVYKATSGYTNANYMYQYQFTGSGGSYVTEFGLHDTNKRIHLGDGWYWAWNTFTTGSTVNWIGTMGMWHYEYRTYSRVYVAKALLAQGDWTNIHPKYWPNVGTSISSSQSILDLTGNHTITSNNLSYDSYGNFSFNGSSSYLSIPNSSALNMTSGLTIDAWVNFDTNSDDFIFEKSDVNTQYSLFSHGDDITFRTYHSGDGGYHSQSPTKVAIGVVNRRWVHIVGSWDGSTKRIYVDGILKNSVSKSGSLVTTSLGASVGRFGGNSTGYFFNGRIGSVKVYDKGLTPDEVLRNYNATKELYLGYQTLNLVNSSNITLTNNNTRSVTISKNADNGSWNGQAYSVEAFTAPCTIEFTKLAEGGDNGASYAMIGWNTDPTTDAGYGSIDHAAYPFRMDRYEVYNNGSYINPGQTWDSSKKFYLVYDTDGYIRHYNGDKLLYSANYGIGNTVYLDMSLYNTNTTYCKFSDVRICRKSWNGTRYT